jgi:hypothetical protein
MQFLQKEAVLALEIEARLQLEELRIRPKCLTILMLKGLIR